MDYELTPRKTGIRQPTSPNQAKYPNQRVPKARIGLALVLGIAIFFLPVAAEAQQAGKIWRVGVLMPERAGVMEAITEGLRDHEYVEGRNLILISRRAARLDQAPSLAAELVRLNPDVLVAVTGNLALALRAATKTIPIVMATSGDAVGQGLVASLARPGGNVTGFTVISPELAAKRLQILKEVAPKSTRIGVLGCPQNGGGAVHARQWSEVQPVAQKLGLDLVPTFIRRPGDLSGALENAMTQKIQAVLAFDCNLLTPPDLVTTVVNAARLPAVYHASRFVEAGGLMSYGADGVDFYRRSAAVVDKILKGARPADIPVEQPTKFELVINLKTAKTLNLRIPQSLLLRADRLIE